ncbi:DNA-binding CsgD family transcriptional regulator/PAS domain-containing protein [Streptomyces tendae]|uniref:LuxR C-terminal-related transcriptional regulator n=1 Tax=Streptomyces tendae TaxID=1932 RepID=UPI0038344452
MHDARTPELRHRYVNALLTALTLDEVSDAFMSVGSRLISSDVHGLYQFGADGRRVVSALISDRQHFVDDYEQYGRADDPVLDFAVREKRPIDSSRAVAAEIWASSGAHAAIAVDGYLHSLEAPLLVAGSVFGTVNFARSPKRSPFSDEDLVTARFATEQLALAMERALRFELTGHRTSMLEYALDRIAQPVIVTDLESRVLFRNRAARDLPSPTTSRSAHLLNESIAEAMDSFRTLGKRVHTSSARSGDAGEQVITRSFRLSEPHDAAVTLVFNAGTERPSTLPAWNVLTRREQEIVELVARGLSTEQIAESAFITENTVKQHLKRIFAKVDVHNRAELVQKVWAHGEARHDG